MDEIILVYITNPDRETAKKVARCLLEKRLIACANIFAVDSLYWWEGKIEETGEFVLIAKTADHHYARLCAEVTGMHPYRTPCIVRIPADANPSFFQWLAGEIENP